MFWYCGIRIRLCLMKETCYLSSKKLLNMCTVQCFKDEMTEFCTCTYKRYICVWEYSSETKWIADLKFLIGFNCQIYVQLLWKICITKRNSMRNIFWTRYSYLFHFSLRLLYNRFSYANLIVVIFNYATAVCKVTINWFT